MQRTGIIDELKNILSIKIKPRLDSYSDQFSRVFLLKITLIGSFITGLNWYSDEIECIIPLGESGEPWVNSKFVSQSCWINGLYIYEEIKQHENEIGYYGLPVRINLDGRRRGSGELCDTTHDNACVRMTKTFLVQFQYMVFLLMALSFIYYSPYIFFRYVNSDFQSLKLSIKARIPTHEIVENYFNHKINTTRCLHIRLIGNMLCKAIYIFTNVLAAILVDNAMNGRFFYYGTEWLKWLTLDNSVAYDYMGHRKTPKPSEALLPSFALCEIYEIGTDLKHQIKNHHKFVCELSQHVLFQYVLLITWFAMACGIVVSVLGFCWFFIDLVTTIFSLKYLLRKKRLSPLTIREYEYLSWLRTKDMAVFGQIIEQLQRVNEISSLSHNESVRETDEIYHIRDRRKQRSFYRDSNNDLSI